MESGPLHKTIAVDNRIAEIVAGTVRGNCKSNGLTYPTVDWSDVLVGEGEKCWSCANSTSKEEPVAVCIVSEYCRNDLEICAHSTTLLEN